MQNMKIHHIGYLVKSIDSALPEFDKLGFSLTKPCYYDHLRDVNICFVLKDGYCVELIAPEKNSKLYDMIKRYKNTAYHICYEVDSVEDSICELTQKGYVVFKEIQPAPAISDTAQVAFLMSSIGMVELVQL